ncbi:MAG: hypothetical protein HQ478_15625 [Chloroflexi bacterium]|nr:hypothetical protein [Chloroflexota bacterium]
MYGQNYVQQIEQQVSFTTATPQSIETLANTVVRLIQEIDEQIVTALQQRRRIVALMEPFNPLYQSVAGGSLVEALPGLTQLNDDPTDLSARDLAEALLEIANEMWDDRTDSDDLLSLGQLEHRLKEYAEEENVKIPWSNPRAVISTILRRSEKWERATPKQYRKINDSSVRFL